MYACREVGLGLKPWALHELNWMNRQLKVSLQALGLGDASSGYGVMDLPQSSNLIAKTQYAHKDTSRAQAYLLHHGLQGVSYYPTPARLLE